MIYYVISLLSQIYCDGPILEAVQNNWLFNDSKHFVDMPLKHHPIDTLRNFQEFEEFSHGKKDLIKFIEKHFKPPGGELDECYPKDWNPNPSKISRIPDYHYRKWALALNRIWKELCRETREEVRQHPELYSILYVPNPFIIPGGRFREFYYWDTYWILKGLLFSQMYDTAEGMIRNLAYMVDNHGFVPNGGRVYYLFRSQPPMLIPMVFDYYLATGNMEFVLEMLPKLEREYNFWLRNRATTYYYKGVKMFKYYQYKVNMKTPRPESYREDAELALHLKNHTEKMHMYSNIAAAAETGWDFSSRWFAQDGPDASSMKSIRTHSIVPVDLNAFICMNSRILANFFEITGNQTKAIAFHNHYEKAKLAMSIMHWNETDGIWYDYDLETKRHVNKFYLSNALPVFAKCYSDDDAPQKTYQYLQRTGALNFTKGVPTSLNDESAQQWDSSNSWPPLVHMIIEGFRTSGHPDMYEIGKALAMKWLRISHESYITTHHMFEKYNASSEDADSRGCGGEYEVQTGFGWTNGVILDLLDKFGEEAESGLADLDSVVEWIGTMTQVEVPSSFTDLQFLKKLAVPFIFLILSIRVLRQKI